MSIFIISAILFHLPLAFYRDTARRLQRMQYYNPDKAMSYKLDNDIPIEYGGDYSSTKGKSPFLYQPFIYVSIVSSNLLALISLFFAFDAHWAVIIVGNILASRLIIPFLAFVIYPFNTIMTVGLLKRITIICIILGSIFFVAGL